MVQIIGLEAHEATRFRARGLADSNGWLSRVAGSGLRPERVFVIPSGVKAMRLSLQSLHSMPARESDQIAWTGTIGVLRQIPRSAQQVKKSGFSLGDMPVRMNGFLA